MGIIRGRQALHLLDAWSETVLPLSSLFNLGKGAGRTAVNLACIAITSIVLVWCSGWSAFPGEGSFRVENGQIVGGAGVGWTAIYVRLAVSTVLGIAVLLCFVIDLGDSMDEQWKRPVYNDKEAKPESRIWWCMSIIMSSYLCRVVVFGIAALNGLYAANAASVAKSGVSVVAGKDANAIAATGPLFVRSLTDPFGPWGEGPGGCWESAAYVVTLGLIRLALVLFLVGTFFVVLPSIGKAVRRPQEVRTHSLQVPRG